MRGTPIQGPPYNIICLRMYEVIEVKVRWNWDGVSVDSPNGSVIDVYVSNIDTVQWIATLPNKSKGAKTVVIPAASSNTYSSGVLNNMGLNSLLEASGVTLVRG